MAQAKQREKRADSRSRHFNERMPWPEDYLTKPPEPMKNATPLYRLI